MSERNEKTWKGAVKYFKVAAAGTLMASIGSAYTFDTVSAEAYDGNSDAKVEQMFNQYSVLSEQQFKDVHADFWAADSINWAASKGLIKADENGKFNPNDFLTEEQFAVMLTRFYNEFSKNVNIKYDSGKGSWADSAYNSLSVYKIPLLGYKNDQARKSPIKKGAIAQVIAYVQGQNTDLESAIKYSIDSEIAISFNEDGTTLVQKFGAGDKLTKATATVLFHRLDSKGKTSVSKKIVDMKNKEEASFKSASIVVNSSGTRVIEEGTEQKEFSPVEVNSKKEPVFKENAAVKKVKSVYGKSYKLLGYEKGYKAKKIKNNKTYQSYNVFKSGKKYFKVYYIEESGNVKTAVKAMKKLGIPLSEKNLNLGISKVQKTRSGAYKIGKVYFSFDGGSIGIEWK